MSPLRFEALREELGGAHVTVLRRDGVSRSRSSYRLPDGATFVALLELDDGADNPLPGLPEFQEFQEKLPGWLAEPPSPEKLTVVGTYR